MLPLLIAIQATPAETAPSPFDFPSLVKRVIDWAVGFAPNLIGALLTLVIGVWLAKLVTRGLRKLMVRGKVDESLAHFLSGLVYYGLLALVLIAVAGKLGVETTSFVALLGAVGLAVGFALQGSLGNLAAGVMILFFRPFRVGDVIDAGGQSGAVQEIGVFATILATVDNRKVIVPNSAITGGSIVNATAHPTRRVDLSFLIAPDEDVPRVKSIVLRAASAEAKVLKDPPAEAVALTQPDGLNVKLMAWVATADYVEMQGRLFEHVRQAFVAEGVRAPIPVREIRMVGQPVK